jgi:hypothetical protein
MGPLEIIQEVIPITNAKFAQMKSPFANIISVEEVNATLPSRWQAIPRACTRWYSAR